MSVHACPGFADASRHHLMIAGAGAGKTTFLVERALSLSGYTLITTYTIRNSEEIKAKIRELNHGVVPGNIEVLPWDTFLIQHGARPFRRSLCFSNDKPAPRISGMLLVNSQTEGAPRWTNSRQYEYSMTSSGRTTSPYRRCIARSLPCSPRYRSVGMTTLRMLWRMTTRTMLA